MTCPLVLDISRQLGSEPDIKFMKELAIQKNATRLKKGSTPKLKQAHPYFPGSYLVKFFPRGWRNSEVLALDVSALEISTAFCRALGERRSLSGPQSPR